MSSVFNLIEHCLALAEGPDLKARICLFQASTDCSAYTAIGKPSDFLLPVSDFLLLVSDFLFLISNFVLPVGD